MSSKHQDYLNRHCRVCSKLLGTKFFSCKKYNKILQYLNVDVALDNSLVHPEYFCQGCLSRAKRLMKGSNSKQQEPVEWLPHDNEFCPICDGKCKGGRPKTTSTGPGRPTVIQQHLTAVAAHLPEFALSQIMDEGLKEHVTCTRCHLAANRPVQILPCKSLACYNCCVFLSQNNTVFNCPGCSCEHEPVPSTFAKLSPFEEKGFNELVLKCEKCDSAIPLESFNKNCEHHNSSHTKNGTGTSMTVQDIMNQPMEVEPSKLESRVAMKVVSRFLHSNKTKTCTLSTGDRLR